MRKPDHPQMSGSKTPNKKSGAATQGQTLDQIKEVIKGYNNFVSTLKLVRKHRPFAENDNLPKISQPEDHIEVSSPRSTDSEQEKMAAMDGIEDQKPTGDTHINSLNIAGNDVDFHPTITGDDPLSDPSDSLVVGGSLIQQKGAEMGPNCNLKSILSSEL